MAQQNINIGAANSDDGDNYFDAFTKIEANTTELYDQSATNTDAIATKSETYWFNENNTLGDIVHAGGAVNTFLTNNSAGALSDQYNPNSNPRLWNSTTNSFDFSSLKIGDIVRFRVDIEVDTTAANQEIDLLMSLAEGTVSPYELAIKHAFYKSSSTGNKVTGVFEIFIGNDITRDGGARFRFSSPNNATIKVNGWFTPVTVV